MINPVGKFVVIALCFIRAHDAFSQTRTQRITGTVLDKVSKQPLTGANVFIKLEGADTTIIGTVSDLEGRKKLASPFV